MMQTTIITNKHVYTALALLVFIYSTIIGCSSSDDEGGGTIDIPATVPVTLNYEVSQGTGESLVLSQNPEVTVTSAMLTGSFNRDTEAFTLDTQTSAMSVDATDFLGGLLSNNFNTYTLAVNAAMSWVGDNNPTSGELEVFGISVDSIKVTVTTTGVDITYPPGGSTSSYTWEEFDALFDTGTEAEKIANFAYSMLRALYDQGELVLLALEFIGENVSLIEDTGSVSESCDTFPFPPTPPVSTPGMSELQWYDANNDIGISTGDRFYLSFTQCWDDEPGEFDTLFNGTVNLNNYTEVVTNGVITRVGFESAGGTSGVDFDFLTVTETETAVTEVIIETGEAVTLNGGFSMVFTSP